MPAEGKGVQAVVYVLRVDKLFVYWCVMINDIFRAQKNWASNICGKYDFFLIFN